MAVMLARQRDGLQRSPPLLERVSQASGLGHRHRRRFLAMLLPRQPSRIQQRLQLRCCNRFRSLAGPGVMRIEAVGERWSLELPDAASISAMTARHWSRCRGPGAGQWRPVNPAKWSPEHCALAGTDFVPWSVSARFETLREPHCSERQQARQFSRTSSIACSPSGNQLSTGSSIVAGAVRRDPA